VRRSDRASKSKVYHIIHVKHRDEVEAPITEWLQEAYELSDVLVSNAVKVRAKSKRSLDCNCQGVCSGCSPLSSSLH